MKRLLFLFLSVVAASHGQILYSYLDAKASPTHQVCVMPVEATFMRVGVKGGERLVKESEEWAAKFGALLHRAIAEAGGDTKAELSMESPEGNDDARQSVLRIRQKYQNIF